MWVKSNFFRCSTNKSRDREEIFWVKTYKPINDKYNYYVMLLFCFDCTIFPNSQPLNWICIEVETGFMLFVWRFIKLYRRVHSTHGIHVYADESKEKSAVYQPWIYKLDLLRLTLRRRNDNFNKLCADHSKIILMFNHIFSSRVASCLRLFPQFRA